jgi:hypothetical protein
MGKGGGGSAPPPPDYRAAAIETAAGDLEAARANAAANRVNQVTPYGALTYSQNPELDQFGNPTFTATQTLSPDQQKLLDYQNRTSVGLGELTGTGLDYVNRMMQDPFSTSTLPTLQSSVGNADLQRLTGNVNLGMVGQGPQALQVGQAQQNQMVGQGPQFNQIGDAAQLQTSLQDQGMAGWDRASDLMMQRLRPQMDIQNENLDVKLANQGITAGTEAYNRAKQSLGMQQNDLLTQAQLQSQGIGQNLFNQALQGGQFGNQALTQQNQTQLANLGFNNQLGQQGYQNQLAGTQFNNAAMNQNYQNLLAGQGFNAQQNQLDYSNQLAAQAANNPALQQMFSNQQAQQQANNAIAQQMFGNQLTNANLANTARQQGFNELAYMRNEPLNTLNAVRTGSQVTNPSFVSVPQQAVTRGADMLGAATAQGNYDTAAANAAQAGQSGMTSGLMSLAGTGMMAF